MRKSWFDTAIEWVLIGLAVASVWQAASIIVEINKVIH